MAGLESMTALWSSLTQRPHRSVPTGTPQRRAKWQSVGLKYKLELHLQGTIVAVGSISAAASILHFHLHTVAALVFRLPWLPWWENRHSCAQFLVANLTPHLTQGFVGERQFKHALINTGAQVCNLADPVPVLLPMADFVACNDMMELGLELGTGGGLIDALPDDVFIKCLVRVPLQCHANLQRVSRALKELVLSKEYYEQRRTEGVSGSYVCMLQPMPMSTEVLAEKSCSFMAASFDPVYGVTVLDVAGREWQRLPAIPGLPRGLPTFCKLAVVKGKLVAMGGWWQSTWEPSRSVFVYDFSSQRWSQGADMLSVRNFFACGAVGSKVIVAGGHDAEKKALRSVEAFDIETGCWETLQSMREERDECTGVVIDGRLYVVSGYGTESQGAFRKSAEVYDAGANAWSLIENMWPLVARDADVANPSSLAAMAGRLYGVHGKDVVMYSPEKNAWSVVEKVPEDADKGEMASFSVAATGSSLVVTGLARKNDTATLRTLTFTPACGPCKAQWQTVPSDEQFLNLTQTSCSFEM